jgi:transposase
MTYHAGIDVSLETSSICIVDRAGSLVRGFKVVSDPEALAAVLRGGPRISDERISLVRSA